MEGWLIDADYITENDRAVIRLWCKDDDGIFVVYDRNFEPYFYLIPHDNVDVSDVENVVIQGKSRVIKPERVEWVKKKIFGKEVEVLKIVAKHPQDVPKLREEMKKFGEVREADILFAYRYLIDKDLACMDGIIADGEVRKERGLRVIEAEKVRRKRLNGFPELSVLVFDCEMLPSFGMPDPERDPIIVIGVKSGDFEEIIHGNEREILTKFVKIVRDLDPDIIAGYNQDNFDWPYMKKRAEKLSVKLNIGRDGSELSFRGGRPKIVGRLNVDLYDIAMRLDVKVKTLEKVAEFLGKKVEIADIEAKDIRKKWLEGDKASVLRYAKQDVLNTYFIAEELLPLHYDLSKMIRIPLDDVTRIGRGKQVDWLLFSEAYKMNEIAPNPSEIEESYEGAFVLEPVRGLHENVYCLDFACHPEDTVVIVKGKGKIKISEVREGDYVLGKNGWHKVRKVWVYDYDGVLIDVNGLKCTPKHKIPIFKENRVKDVVAAAIAQGKVKGKVIKCAIYDEISEIEKNIDSEEVLKGELVGILLADGCLLKRDAKYFDKSRGKERVSHQHRVEICINSNEKEFKDRIKFIFKKLWNVELYEIKHRNRNGITLATAKKEIYNQVVNLLNEIKKFDARSVLRGFFEGGGSVNLVRRTIVFNQSIKNKDKLKIVAELLNKLGIGFNWYEFKGSKPMCIIEISKRDDIVKFATLVGAISKNKSEKIRRILEEKNFKINGKFYKTGSIKVTTCYYKGKVYDLTLEGEPYYFANGILTHNSMYPSIMIAFNISPDTLVIDECDDCYIAPEVGYKFKKHPDGFFKRILADLIRKRREIKERMKEIDRNSLEYKLLNIRQQTLKVLANSILPDEWLPVINEGKIKFVKIGEFIDGFMEKHRGKVKKIGDSEVLEVDGIKAFSFDKKDKKAQIKQVKALIRHRYDGNVYDIELESGRRIKITEGHSLFTVRNGEITEISGSEIKKGDLIVVPKAIRLDGTATTLNIPKLLCRLPRSETKNIVLTIPVKGRKNFFKGMLRALKWILGEDGRKIRTFSRYAKHLENLGLVELNSFEADWDALKAYKSFCERLVENAKYDHNKREYVIRFDDLRDVIDKIPDGEFKDWKIGAIGGFKIRAIIQINEEFGKLLGYYVSEGYSRVQRNKRDGSYTVRIYNHNQSVLNEVQSLAEKFFGKVRRGKTYVEIPKKIAYLVFRTLCGSKANNKRIPSEILTSPENVRWAFLEGYFVGDGDIHPSKRLRLSTKSEVLVNQLVFLLNSLGVSSIKLGFDSGVFRIYINEDLKFLNLERERNSYYSNIVPKEILEEVSGKKFQWIIEGDLVLDRVKDVKVEKYSGRVYDLSVQDNENFLVGFGLLYAHNSFYGYMGWSGARWYCRPCAEATTAWGRHFIKKAIGIARNMGFEVLYSDTDSLFVKKEGISESEVGKLIKAISKEMPIEIDIDEVYRTIFFVEKKRYAGLTKDGRIIVKGLEVRRGDWCELAKEVQKDVIETILREKNPEKALKLVRKVIEKIKKGDYPLEKFVIYKGLTKKPSKYESMQAHVKAALRAMEMGIMFTPGSKVGYVVLEGSGNVGDRAYPIELVEGFDGEFVEIRTKSGVERRRIDKNYYINNQVIPSVLRILEQFGYNELSIKGEAQTTLDAFF